MEGGVGIAQALLAIALCHNVSPVGAEADDVGGEEGDGGGGGGASFAEKFHDCTFLFAQIVGLKGRPELNGQRGSCGELVEAKGRYPVRLESGEAVLIKLMKLVAI